MTTSLRLGSELPLNVQAQPAKPCSEEVCHCHPLSTPQHVLIGMPVELNTTLFNERVKLVYDAWAVSYFIPALPLRF